VCGRFTLTAPAALADHFGLANLSCLKPRYNVAPTQPIAALRVGGGVRALALLRWGLVPPWAADLRDAARLINARAETVADKPAFRAAYRQRRCLVLADGFYEWQPLGKRRQPFHFRRRDGQPFAFAGLWERWQPLVGEPVETCAILTTTANPLVRPVHERMPVILAAADHDEWLDPARADPRHLLTPYPAEEMTAVAVSPWVGNPRNDDLRCLAPASGVA
jgi:putative SOS response-associated peptidase YedK